MRTRSLVVVATVLATLAACSSSKPNGTSGASQKPIDIAISYFAEFDGGHTAAVAQKEGFFKAAGLNVHFQLIDGGPVGVTALNAGKLQFTYMGPGPIRLAVGGKCVIIAVSDVSIGEAVIAKKSVTSSQGLRGKQVGLSIGTTGSLSLALALDSAGMKLSDVKQVNIPDPASIVAAFASGRVPAVSTWAPFTGQLLKKIPDSHVLWSDKDLYPSQVLPDVWCTTREMLRDHPDVVERFMWAAEKANEFALANLDQAISDIADFTRLPVATIKEGAPPDFAKLIPSQDLATNYANGTAEKWFTAIADTNLRLGTVKTLPPPSEYLDFTAAIAAATKLSQSQY